MKIVGIVVEHNPLHNGHLYHINEAKKKGDLLIAVMGGNYTMRGEISPYDKFFKTSLALKYGIDLVVELPMYYTVQNADIFAYASINILRSFGITDIVFGSESNDISYLYSLLEISNSDQYNKLIKENMLLGYSYPKSSALAFKELGYTEPKSGDILNICYLKALKNYDINPWPIKRDIGFSSASVIREQGPNNNVPIEVEEFYKEHGFNNIENYIDLINYLQINKDYYIDEGLENIITKPFNCYSDLLKFTTSKRYTKSRINRFIIKSLLRFKDYNGDPYLRILGMNEKGKRYLSEIKKTTNVIVKVKEGLHPLLDLEIKASALYSLKYYKNIRKEEFLKPIII